MKYTNLIQIICKQIYLTSKLDSNMYFFKENLNLMAMKCYSTLLRSTKLEPYRQMEFSVIPRIPFFRGLTCLPGTQCILSLADKCVGGRL